MAYEYGFQLPGLPDLSNLDFSNIDFSKLNIPVPAQPVPPPPPVPQVAPPPMPVTPPGLPDLSNLDFSNIDLSNLNIPGVNAPMPEPMPTPLPTPASPRLPTPTLAPVKPLPPVGKQPQAPIATPRVEPTIAAPPVMSEPPPPAPVAPVAPPPPPAPTVPDLSNLDFSNIDLSNLDLSAIPGFVPPPAPPSAPPAPPAPPALPPAAVGLPDRGIPDRALEPNVPIGIESLAGNYAITEDYTESMPSVPSGIAAGPYSTAEVNNTAPSTSIPMPDGSTFEMPDLSGMDFSNIDLSGVDLSGLYMGGETGMPSDQAPAPTTTSTVVEDTETPGFEGLTDEQRAAIANLDLSGLGNIRGGLTGVPAGSVYTDGQLANMGGEPGSTVVTGVDQDAYGNMTPEQQAALDAYLASNPGGLVTTPFGNFNIPGVPTTTAVTPRPVVEALQNLSVDRATSSADPRVASAYQLSGEVPVQRPGSNPFVRPESQQGIGSLVPSGG